MGKRQIHERHLRQQPGEKARADEDAREGGDPQGGAGVAALGLGAEHPGPAAHKKAQQCAGHKALPPVLLPGAFIGVPPVAGLIAQGAQHGIDHTGQERPADQAADHTADDSQQRRPGHHAKDSQRRAGQKAQHAEEAGFIQRPQVAAQQFKKARNADLTALDGSFVCFV